MGSGENHKGILVPEPGSGLKLRHTQLLEFGRTNAWRWDWGRDGKICLLKAISGTVHLLASPDLFAA